MAQKKILSTDDLEDTPTEDLTTKTATSQYLFDHAADLDAHTSNIYELMRTGQDFGSPCLSNDYYNSIAVAQDTLYALPFPISRALTASHIIFRVVVLEAAKTARVGIYKADGTNLYPSTLVVDAGTSAVATTGQKTVTISGNQSLTKGLYYVVVLTDATGDFDIMTRAVSWTPLGRQTSEMRNFFTGWEVAQAYGALPNPFTAGGSLGATGGNKGMDLCLRLLSLD